jgi:hypothetical protein
MGGSAGAPDRLSFGYAPSKGGTLVDANRLRDGDRSLTSSGVRLRVIDYVQPASAASASLAMDVRFEPFHAATFRAWQSGKGRSRGSNPIGLHVPVDRREGLKFALVRGVSLSTAETIEAQLLPGTGTGPKLRAGYYVVALDPDRRSLDWSRYAISPNAAGQTLLDSAGIQPPFVYGLLSVAPAS